jgi:hypothetical protein
VDCSGDVVSVGDALIFDGLLLHCGLENRYEVTSKNPKFYGGRYFYYAAFSRSQDPNVSATGI